VCVFVWDLCAVLCCAVLRCGVATQLNPTQPHPTDVKDESVFAFLDLLKPSLDHHFALARKHALIEPLKVRLRCVLCCAVLCCAVLCCAVLCCDVI
jgi:hypothetical protein